jgi:hypothetical protein
MKRRDFVKSLTATSGITMALGLDEILADRVRATDSGTIAPILIDSGCSLVDTNKNQLTDDRLVAVWSEQTATNSDADGNGDATDYGESSRIPAVGIDGNVVGLPSPMIANGTNWQYGNEQFVLNMWDELLGAGTVLFDEGHDQYYTLSKCTTFQSYAEENGYAIGNSLARVGPP